MLTSKQRVLTACEFRRPDRIPRFDGFWDYPDSWRERLGPVENLSDIAIWCPDESTFPSRARRLREEGGYVYDADGWGRIGRTRPGAYFSETLEVPIPPGADPGKIDFEPAEMDSRFLMGHASQAAMLAALEKTKAQYCLFGKTGGPYLRTTFVRGETQFLMDIGSDPELARVLADKVGDHLTAVGVEEIRRWDLRETGIWIYDDMGFNQGPMVGPAMFEIIFLPAYRRMIRAYKQAGAPRVFLHSDGNIMPLMDMLVDAGLDGINPMEKRAGMYAAELRRRYPRLVLTGGMCNTQTLPYGTPAEIEAEARELIDLGRDGGLVIGTHSISPEIPLENFVIYHETCLQFGNFADGFAQTAR